MFGLKIAFFLLLATGTMTVRGIDLGEKLHDDDASREMAVNRPKRWSGMGLFDALRGKGSSPRTKPTGSTGGNGFGFDLEDALHPGSSSGPKPTETTRGNGFGFNLDDALRPDGKPTSKAAGETCQEHVVQKLNAVIENQKQQIRLLAQLIAQSSSARLR